MSWCVAITLFPPRAAIQAAWVDSIFLALLLLCGAITAGVALCLLIACLRYRQGAHPPERKPHKTSYLLEIFWTGATLAAFLGVFVWAAIVYLRMSEPPADAETIQVVARQWMWKAQHANGRREINELHLAVGQPVKLVMTSEDVIHDFFVPAFRTKQDVVPGRYTSEWFTPTRPGRYHLYCAEYCGSDHSRMGGWVEVMEAHAFARWLAETAPPETLVATGERLFVARGCSGCHVGASAVRAPQLFDLYRRVVPLEGGRTTIADDQYLHDSILLPNKEIVAGYQPLMPSYAGQLGEEDVMALIAYLKSLTGTPP